MSETFKNPTPETLSGEKGPWMVTDMNLEKLGLIPTLFPLSSKIYQFYFEILTQISSGAQTSRMLQILSILLRTHYWTEPRSLL